MTTGPGMETLRDARCKLEPGAALVPEVIPAGPGPDLLHSRLALTDPEVLKGQLAAYSAARVTSTDEKAIREAPLPVTSSWLRIVQPQWRCARLPSSCFSCTSRT